MNNIHFNMNIINASYSHSIDPRFPSSMGGYKYCVPSVGNIKSLSIIITTHDLLPEQIRDELAQCDVYFIYDDRHMMGGLLLDGLVLSYIKGRKIKWNDDGQLIIPLDSCIANEDNIINLILQEPLRVLLCTPKLPFDVQLQVKYFPVDHEIFINNRDWTFQISSREGHRRCIFTKTEFIVIHVEIDIDVLGVQYILYDDNCRVIDTITTNNIIKKRMFGGLYNIIPINYQYSNMKELRKDHLKHMDNALVGVDIINVTSMPQVTISDMNIFSIYKCEC